MARAKRLAHHEQRRKELAEGAGRAKSGWVSLLQSRVPERLAAEVDGQTQYLVSWEGYDEETWVPR